MLQIHPNARTTPVTRAEIACSHERSGVLAQRYGPSLTPISILSFQFNQVDIGNLSLELLFRGPNGREYRNDSLLRSSINRSFVPQIAVFKANRRDRTFCR